jgi:hypothetical protein
MPTCQEELPSRFHGQAGDRRGEAQQFEALGVFAANHLAAGLGLPQKSTASEKVGEGGFKIGETPKNELQNSWERQCPV